MVLDVETSNREKIVMKLTKFCLYDNNFGLCNEYELGCDLRQEFPVMLLPMLVNLDVSVHRTHEIFDQVGIIGLTVDDRNGSNIVYTISL